MHKVHRVLERAGKKVILLGDEAIVRGALESGVGFASTYPGTPASEIGDTFSEIAEHVGIYFEYSVNEKVATEAAAGAAFSGVRSIVSFKHFGFNVASDSIFPLSYYGLSAGMVIAFADDPNCWSSGQSEQDSRYYSRIAHLPLLEPADASECRDFTKLAFELSERFSVPALIRITTRVSHAVGVVKLTNIKKPKISGEFIKDRRWHNMPPEIIKRHAELHRKLDKMISYGRRRRLNIILNRNAGKRLGVITSGVSFNYVMDAMEELGIKLPVLKLGMSYPVDKQLISHFIKDLERVFVVEELEPVVEVEVRAVAKDANPSIIIHGKDLLPPYGDLRTGVVATALGKLIGKKIAFPKKPKGIEKLLIARKPIMCPGCPHRASFWSAKSVAPTAVFGGDIGCYILGIFKPMETQDWIISMAATEGISHGIKKVSKKNVIAFIGDSTFFHSGISSLVNTVYNGSNPLIMVLDNRVTAMTGHQPNPGSGVTGMGKVVKELSIAEIAKACGVENVAVVNPFNVAKTKEKIKEFLQKNTASVIISKQECRLAFMRRAAKEGIKVPVFQIDKKKCTKCGICLYEFGCPAISRDENGEFYIDPDWCWGCGVCAQVCPEKAISVKT